MERAVFETDSGAEMKTDNDVITKMARDVMHLPFLANKRVNTHEDLPNIWKESAVRLML
jgi:hypothetical protein